MKFDNKPGAKGSQRKISKAKQPTPQPPAKPLLTTDQWIDLTGYIFIALAALTILGALSPTQGDFTSGWLNILKNTFGWGVYLAPLIMGLIGIYLVLRRFGNRFPRLAPVRVVGATLAYIAALATLHLFGMISQPDGQLLAEQGSGGGYAGWIMIRALRSALGDIGAVIVLFVLWVMAFMFISNVSLVQIIDTIQRRRSRARELPPVKDVIVPPWDRGTGGDDELVIHGLKSRRTASRAQALPEEDDDELPPPQPRPITPSNPQRTAPADQPGNARTSLRMPGASTTASSQRLPPPRIIGGIEPETTPAPAASVQEEAQDEIMSRLPLQREWTLPDVNAMLDPGSDVALKEADIRMRAQLIEDTLRAFGVPGRVVEVNRGPTITQFGVEPGFTEMKNGKQVKVKVSRISALADDLALALSASRIRIEAPVPGRAVVGIEVPNPEVALVSLRDVMESEEFEHLGKKSRLRLALGQDVSGHPVVADLTAMPHLLIAGTTGSGKSVCVNAIIAALLCFNSPEDLRLLMIDPKRVELTGYNGIPHLIAPVVVELEKVTSVLHWVSREMENRYRTFAKHGTRNILDFNTKVDEQRQAAVAATAQTSASGAGLSLHAESRKLPYIIVVIDELADLMMLAPDETEKTICRLAQMSRATGIHLVIATQRPSVDVVTGLIKANFPARIAFTVATSIDSRVILDMPGAEKLLGRGDMLVVTPDASLPTRAQGCFVSDKEITRIVRSWRAQAGGDNAGQDPLTASMTAPSIPMTGTLDTEARPAQMSLPDIGAGTPTWDEARALSEATTDASASGDKDDKLFQDAVATVRLQGKASISLLQRRLRIGYTRAARLIELMEERGIVGPSMPGSQFREVLKHSDDEIDVEL